jgi:hypothetical protein
MRGQAVGVTVFGLLERFAAKQRAKILRVARYDLLPNYELDHKVVVAHPGKLHMDASRLGT